MTIQSAAKILENWLHQRLSAEQMSWLQQRLSLVNSAQFERDLHISFGLIPRRLGRSDLAPDIRELAEADRVVEGWNPCQWSNDTAARILLLCVVANQSNQHFGRLFKKLCQTADLRESIALYQGLALYPVSDELNTQVGEGLRTSVRAVFEAIAHDNPYPKTHFAELRWNHMVLKALFIDSTLHPIQGLDDRANAELARILCDYAHERWAAGRPVTPELWRCVGPFATDELLDDVRHVYESGSPLERRAAALALSSSNDPAAAKRLASAPDLITAIANRQLTWESVVTEMQQPYNGRSDHQ